MINPNELRIGNWIVLNNSDFICIDKDNISDIVNNPAIFNPILLTPEMLVDWCGFEKSDRDFHGMMDFYTLKIPVKGSNQNEISFCFPKTGQDSFGSYTVNDFHASNNFKYMHELQNLYRYLSGQEMPINQLQELAH